MDRESAYRAFDEACCAATSAYARFSRASKTEQGEAWAYYRAMSIKRTEALEAFRAAILDVPASLAAPVRS